MNGAPSIEAQEAIYEYVKELRIAEPALSFQV